MKKKLEMYGLYFGCPEIKPLATCPLEKYRKGTALEKLKLIENLSEEETNRILRLHQKCLIARIRYNQKYDYSNG